MHLPSIFGPTLSLAQRSLGVGVLRQEVIANNIANVDTPYYKRKTISFESELNRVIKEHSAMPKYPLKTSDARHINTTPTKTIYDVMPRISQEHDTNFRNDKNNVDIEKEMSDLNKNALHYNAATTMIKSHLMRLKTAVTHS